MTFRLAKGIKPINYNIFIKTDLKKSKFFGKEIIEMNLTKNVKKIILNNNGPKLKNAKIVTDTETIQAKIKIDEKNELAVLNINKIVKGIVKLFIEFSGTIKDDLLGYYKSKYIKNGKENYLATTQFEAPYARRAFPCFDEPQYKATFELTMEIDKNLKAISNMPIKNEIITKNKKFIEFQKTPKMSSYLLYFGVGDFEFIEDKMNDVLIRVVTTPGKTKYTKFAMEFAKKILQYFQNYSEIPYPLPKLDLIAVPDFAAGAMENWGAITFREIYLLYSEKTSTNVKKFISMIIAHEIWHQWSGDLVTMKWWNDLWLNESFATFMAYKAVDYFYPEWNMWEDFVRGEKERALDEDSLKTTHSIEVKIKNPHEIEEIFDNISYSKGGSILRMLESYLTEEIFRKGVKNYLMENQYNNATSQDLWSSMSKVSHKPIKDVMISWIKQAGHPVIDADLKGEHLFIKQRRLVHDYKDKTKWLIPVSIKTSSGIVNDILDNFQKKIKLNNPKWIKLNHDKSGFYRVHYSDKTFSSIENLVCGKKLPALERWGVQSDFFKLSLNGEKKLRNYIDFIMCYSNEDEYIVLSSIYSHIREIHFVFSDENFWDKMWTMLKKTFSITFKRNLKKLGWNPKKETQKDTLLRELCIKALSFFEDSEVIEKGNKIFQKYLKTGKIHADIRSSVLYLTAINGNDKTYKKIIDLYKKTTNPEEKVIMLSALGQFRDKNLLKKSLEFCLSKDVRTQDMPILYSSIASNIFSRTLLLDWMIKNWKKLKKHENSWKMFLHIIESFITAYVNDTTELKNFFITHKIKYKTTIDKSFEIVNRNIKWKNDNRKDLENYFKNLN